MTTSANSILMSHWDRNIPVNVSAIARAMGVDVRQDATLTTSGDFSYINQKPIIRYNPNESSTRQRFTIAHELGHFALAHGTRNREAPDFSVRPYDPIEAEANRFAAELLMPKIAIQFMIMKKNVTDIKKLAKAFEVSPVAMEFRLKGLGWLGK